MRVAAEPVTLKMKHPWKIAREEVMTEAVTVCVRVEHEGIVGLGEAKPSTYYHDETVETVLATAPRAAEVLGSDPFRLEDTIDELRAAFPEAPATVAALDMALHDLVGKTLGVPLYRLFGLDPANTPRTSFTLGIDSLDVMLAKLEEAREYPILKIKVGFDGDVETLQAIRDNTDAIIRVDANTNWTVDEAIERINRMEPLAIELVEQPIPPKDFDGLRRIRESTNILIMADEDSVTSADLPGLVGCVDAINIKLMKCTGLREAMRMIHVARTLGMRIMLGCMAESSLALTAAAHLTPLTEYADLDMNLLITNDPFEGLGVADGKIILPGRPGIGVVPRA